MNYQQYFNEEITDEEILRAFAIVLPYLNQLSRDDTAYGLSDLQKYLFYVPADHFDLHVTYGTEVVDTVKKCLKSGDIEKEEIPAEVLGKAINVIALPIKNTKGQIIGSISNGIDVDASLKLITSVSEAKDLVSKVSDSIYQMAKSATTLAQSGQKGLEIAQETMKSAKNTTEILDIIKSIADRTNLLGLNAAIEAARAGEHGRGFNVVSSEIRTLANRSKESVVNTKEIIENINTSVLNITKAIEETAAISEEQAAAAEEISANVAMINENLKSLSEFSKRFV